MGQVEDEDSGSRGFGLNVPMARNGTETSARLREGAAGRAQARPHLDALVPRVAPRLSCSATCVRSS
eukprot:4757364-Pyramimonas_sp.AAC.1